MVWDLRVYAALKLIHVLLAAAWVGAGILSNLVLMPVLARATPMTRREVMGAFSPRMLRFSNMVGGLTLLSGLVLLIPALDARGLTWGGLTDDPWGRFIAFGLIMNLLALYLVNFAIRPTARVMGKLQQELPPHPPPPPHIVCRPKRRA